MRYILSSGSLYTYGLDRVFALTAEAGFDGVEVLVDLRFDTRQPDYLHRLVEHHGLPVCSVHAPFWPSRLPAWPHDYPGSIAAAAELARAMGAGIVVTHLPRLPDRSYARWLRQELAAWQQAHPQPVIAVENMPTKWVRWWPFAPLDLWRLNRVALWSAFPHLMLDTTHLATKGLDPLEIYPRVRQQVAHVHLSNARRVGRRVTEHRRLEDGDLRLDIFLHRLAQDGYAGLVVVELDPRSLDAEDEDKVRAHLRQQIAFCREHGG
jgi:sugar phosphate isomerase/epimerase